MCMLAIMITDIVRLDQDKVFANEPSSEKV